MNCFCLWWHNGHAITCFLHITMERAIATSRLFHGIERKDVKLVKQALLHKANVKAKKGKRNLLSYCVKYNFIEGVDLLVEAKASFLRHYQCDPLAFCMVNSSPLLRAVLQENEPMVQKLLSHRSYFNKELANRACDPTFDIIQFPRRNGYTVMHHAAELEKPNMLRILVEAKGDVNFVGGHGSFRYTPLVRAIRAGKLENVQYLMHQNTRLSIQDYQGQTAWNYADSESMMQLLILGGMVKSDEWQFTLTKNSVVTDELVFSIPCPSKKIAQENVSAAEVQ